MKSQMKSMVRRACSVAALFAAIVVLPDVDGKGLPQDPVALGHPLSYWLEAIEAEDPNRVEMAFDAIVEMGPEAGKAIPVLTRIVARPFAPIRPDLDSPSEMHAKLLDIHLRAGAVDGLGAIGVRAASAAEAVILWGLTLRVVADKPPASPSLFVELVGMDVLERMRAAGTVARFGAWAADDVQALIESPDNERRKFAAAILSDTTVSIAAELMTSRDCKDRKTGYSLLSAMWPVVAKEHFDALKGVLECVDRPVEMQTRAAKATR